MANTQTTVPAFVASQVLTAEEMTQSASTGVPVFATTVTRDAGFGGSGQKALAQGQLCYLEATDVVQYYDGSAWATLAPAAPAAASALTFIDSGTASVSSGITIANCFSSTYENYLVTLAFTANLATTSTLMNFGTSSTKDSGANYSYNLEEFSFYAGSAGRNVIGALSDTKFKVNNKQWSNGFTSVTIYAPNLATPTSYYATSSSLNTNPEIETNVGGGVVDTNTQYTDLFFTPTSSTFTFTYKIYGFSNS